MNYTQFRLEMYSIIQDCFKSDGENIYLEKKEDYEERVRKLFTDSGGIIKREFR